MSLCSVFSFGHGAISLLPSFFDKIHPWMPILDPTYHTLSMLRQSRPFLLTTLATAASWHISSHLIGPLQSLLDAFIRWFVYVWVRANPYVRIVLTKLWLQGHFKRAMDLLILFKRLLGYLFSIVSVPRCSFPGNLIRRMAAHHAAHSRRGTACLS